MNEEEYQGVGDTLNLFIILNLSYQNLEDHEKEQIHPGRIEFEGYDWHTDLNLAEYVFNIYQLEQESGVRWGDLKIKDISSSLAIEEEFDSHSPEREWYQTILLRWQQLGCPTNVSFQQIQHIIAPIQN